MTVGTPATGTDTYNYTSGKNRLASIVNASGTRAIGYDGRGNTLSETVRAVPSARATTAMAVF